jgi:hypothetical protein
LTHRRMNYSIPWRSSSRLPGRLLKGASLESRWLATTGRSRESNAARKFPVGRGPSASQ